MPLWVSMDFTFNACVKKQGKLFSLKNEEKPADFPFHTCLDPGSIVGRVG